MQEEAAAAGRPATVVARDAIEAWLHEGQQTVLREAIAAYAADRAGTMVDLDPALEAAGLEAFRTRRRHRRVEGGLRVALDLE